MIEVETKRLQLRQWVHTDFSSFAKMNADSKVMEYYPSLLPESESYAMAQKLAALIAKRGWGLWAVELKSENTFIGYIGLHQPEVHLPFTPCIEIGWRVSSNYWGKGYATEAATEALKYAFKTLQLKKSILV